ncbi:F0F1 ATP synthase subunit B [Cellulophaga fucicola]|uniref:ATP synthase subunit b n=1 Tax=Cellulophaga fucicola TaxID=76595 RepID=A0A1K1QBA9_9FLAO|nr:F0F1 ATP synthase subunit B [Cellulophaga fucicola]SFW56939.1 F-type H+-transporting ATPase subunit b [Cellulophaga fucicola]
MNFTAPESLIFWTTLIFVVFFILLKKFAWKPILGAVKGREEAINDALESAENAKKEMQNLHADNERLLQEARSERDAMLKEAREIKEKIVADAKELSVVEGDKIIAQAKATIESEKKAAVADIKNQVANLSVEIAEKVIKEQLSNKDNQLKLVEDMLADIKLN